MLEQLEKLEIPIRELCGKYHVATLAVFGSAVGSDFSPQSDVDLLVEFQNSLSAGEYASAFFSLQSDLEDLFQRSVDLVTVRSLTNPYFRESVLMERRELYAA